MVGHQSIKHAGVSVIHALAVLGLFTATGDIFFVLNVGGLTVRYTQLMLLVAVALFLLTRTSAVIRLPPGIPYLLVIFGLNLAFIPNAPFLSRNIAYEITFFFNIMLILFYTNYYGISPERLHSLLRWYVWSFIFVACFGLLQFAVGLFGISLLTSQWFIANRFPRINGFSYEPSFFALYLMCGWVALAVLADSSSKIISRRLVVWSLILLSVTIVLSTSRSAIAMMYGVLILFSGTWLLKAIGGRRIGKIRWALASVGLAAPVLIFLYLLNYQYEFLRYL